MDTTTIIEVLPTSAHYDCAHLLEGAKVLITEACCDVPQEDGRVGTAIDATILEQVPGAYGAYVNGEYVCIFGCILGQEYPAPRKALDFGQCIPVAGAKECATGCCGARGVTMADKILATVRDTDGTLLDIREDSGQRPLDACALCYFGNNGESDPCMTPEQFEKGVAGQVAASKAAGLIIVLLIVVAVTAWLLGY